MMKYSVCIETMFKEKPFKERIAEAQKSGFEFFEFWRWQNTNLREIKNAMYEYNIRIASFSGDDEISMISITQKREYVEFIKKSVEAAKFLECPCLVIHSDAIVSDGSALKQQIQFSHEEKVINMFDIMRQLAIIAEKEKILMVFEPLNSTIDHVGNFANDPDMAFSLIRSVSSEYVKVLYDIYHMQIMNGNIIKTIKDNIESIGYIHVADVPGRHEPGTGELNYSNIIQVLKNSQYDGYVGFELEPQNDSAKAIESINNLIR